MRPIEGVGLELRYLWNADLRASEMFRDWSALEAATRLRLPHDFLPSQRPCRLAVERVACSVCG